MKARLWAYPWDLLDEGVDAVMDRIASAGFDEVSVSMLYHGGMLLLPHNPRRRVYFPEDGVVYFSPELRRYDSTLLCPAPSELTRSGDVLAEICAAAASHGLGTLAWVVTLHNARIGLQHPELTLENAYGDHYPYALCPSQPEVAAFLEGLVSDLSRYPLSGIELEALYHQSYPHAWSHPKEGVSRGVFEAQLLSWCFCSACLASAAAEGVDAERLRARVRGTLDERLQARTASGGSSEDMWMADELGSVLPGATGYISARTSTVTTLLTRICAASGLPVHGIVGSGLLGQEWQAGIALADWDARCDGITVNCYKPGHLGAVGEQAGDARSRIGRAALYIGLQATWPQVNSPEDVARRIAEARSASADGVAVYNYGLMPSWHVDWVKRALKETVND